MHLQQGTGEKRPPTFRDGEDVAQDTSGRVGIMIGQVALIEAINNNYHGRHYCDVDRCCLLYTYLARVVYN